MFGVCDMKPGKLVARLKPHALALVRYLGDAPHRRAVATGVALVATHLLGKTLDADAVANGIEIVVGAFGGAWSAHHPEIDTPDGG